MCRTWSFNSAASALVQPSSLLPSGRTAKRGSSRTEERVDTECSLSRDTGRRIESSFDTGDSSSPSSAVLVSSRLSASGGEIV